MITATVPLGHTQTSLVPTGRLFPDLARRELFDTATDLIINLEQDVDWDGGTRHLDLVTGTMATTEIQSVLRSVKTWCDVLSLTFIPVPMGDGKWLLGVSRQEMFSA